MDQPAQQQIDADRAVLRGEAGMHLVHMAQTTKTFDIFCNDMQAAVNELSQFDVRRYLFVTQTCDHLKDCMTAATQQSAIFIDRERGNPDRTRNHISRVMEQIYTLRSHGNRIGELYLRGTVCKNPKPQELEQRLEMHMSLLHQDVQRILDIIDSDLQVGDHQAAGNVPGASQQTS